MYQTFIHYIKGVLGLHPKEKTYFYFNPEGDFQDIRGLHPIDDMTLLPFLFGAIILLILISFGFYFLVKYIQHKMSIRIQVIAKKYLTSLDVSDAKTCAYSFSKWAPHLLTSENKAAYEELEYMLFKYKYKKTTLPLHFLEEQILKVFLEKTYV